MGGLNSEIKEDTTEVMFESAKFARDKNKKWQTYNFKAKANRYINTI